MTGKRPFTRVWPRFPIDAMMRQIENALVIAGVDAGGHTVALRAPQQRHRIMEKRGPKDVWMKLILEWQTSLLLLRNTKVICPSITWQVLTQELELVCPHCLNCKGVLPMTPSEYKKRLLKYCKF